jgi:hypothetical protein
VAASLLALAVAGPALAADLLVPGGFPSIQAAVVAAEDGDVVIVAPGTYVETINTLGKAITIRSTDPASPDVVAATVLDAGGQGTAVRIVSGESYDTVLDGLTITGGNGSLGGGLEISLSDPIIRRCVITGNVAQQGGGAYLYVSSVRFDRCTFEGNEANDGGALHAYAVTRARIDGGAVIGNVAVRGAGIRSRFADVRLRNVVLAENVASDRGGAYFGSDSRLRLNSTIVRDNVASAGGAFGLEQDGVIARNSTIVRNVATTEGFGSVGSGFQSQPLFYNSIVRDNGPTPFDGWINPFVRFSNFEGGASGEGNIDVDPGFVDPMAGDFRLSTGSPSIDAGSDGWVSSFDLRELGGDLRIQGAAVDQGAFEVKGAVAAPPSRDGRLTVTVKDDGALADGVPQPLWLLDEATGEWSPLVRDLPAFAFTADDERQCFWVQAGDTGFLARVPYDTLELEEIGLPKSAANPAQSVSISGMAVRDGVLYGITPGLGGNRLLEIDPVTARVTELTSFASPIDAWDLHYDAAGDRLLLLSSAGSLPSDALGVLEIDPVTFALTPVLGWVNDNPATEAPALQGLATGEGRTYLFRPLYNDLEVYDDASGLQVDAIAVPGGTWVLGGLSWAEGLATGDEEAMPGDVTRDCRVDMQDMLVVLAGYGTASGADWTEGDLDGDGAVGLADLLVVLAHFGGVCDG